MKTTIKSKNQVIIILLTLFAGIFIGWLIFRESEQTEEEILADTELGEETIWTCSMHPQIRQKEPGDCPICGMDLIPLVSEEAGPTDSLSVSMSPTAMQLASVSTARVGTMEAVKSVRLNGKVQPDERLIFSQSSHVPGRIEDLRVNFTGEYVNKSQTLATVYSPDLVTAQEELFEAQKMKEQQPGLFMAAKEKLKNWKLSDEQVQEILRAGEPRENFEIRADVSGYVTEKFVNPGDYIRLGEPIYKIANLSRVWVLFDIYESDMPWVNEGDKISFTVASLPGKEFESSISYIDPVIDPQTRVAKARAEVSNRNQQLKPEMFARGTVKADLPEKSDALIIPKSAVMWTGERSVVYVKTNSEQGVNFSMKEVVLGPSLGDGYVVESGLSENEEIAVHGTFSIDAAAQLAGKPSMMNPKGDVVSAAHNHDGHPAGDTEKKEMNMTEGMEMNYDVPASFREQLTRTYRVYLVMKNAYVASDPEMVSSSAEQVLDAVEGMDMSLLQKNAHQLYMQHYSEMQSLLTKISQSMDIDQQRTLFSRFNTHFAEVIKSFGLDGETAYYQYCPMANQNEGAYWLSETGEIRNPYFGKDMLECGETRDTIK